MRLPAIKPEHMSPERRATYDRMSQSPFGKVSIAKDGSLAGPAVVSFYAPDLIWDVRAMLRSNSQFSERLVEIVTLAVAQAAKDEFVWYAHSRLGAAAGVTEAEMDALRRGETLVLADPVEQAAYNAARAMAQRQDLDDREYAAAAAILSPRLLIEITMIVGHYLTRALQLRVFRLGAPAGESAVFGEAMS
ncbi:MAG: carboxymuconolactone decarboxylase family protein [Sphingobium sp.]